MGQPTKIGKYEILTELGHGGMGVVYKALDRQLDRLVAIKMIIGATPGSLKRFNTEARSTASLQHPNIVTIYDFGEQDGSPYLVMEFLQGMSLDSVIKSGKSLSLASKLNICVEICNGLHYAHERGIIHRDVKPANIMVLESGVKIVDFGIARIGETGISRTEVVGSLCYMSPEQFQGQVLDRRVDIWSTGVLLYQLLTEALPFPAADDAATMYKILHEDPPPLGKYLQNYPPGLDQIIARALSKNRDARYFTAHDLAFDILAILDEQKHAEVSELLKRAEVAVQRTDWAKAEDYLKQVLRVDKQHTQAHQLLSKVQQQIRTQRQLEQARQLRIQADGAFVERRYDEALALIEQAISADRTNSDLALFRDSIRKAKARADECKSAIRQAEEAQHAGDLDEAQLAVQRALEIDPQETSAKALHAAILREREEQERGKKLRALLDRGRDQIAMRDLTGALTTLKQAESIDAASAELFSLLQVLHAAREEQVRKAKIERLARLIEDSLSREDYPAAVALANEGLQRYPQDKGLLQFKSLAETQQRRVQLKTYAKEQFLVARRLLDEGKNLDALSSIESALRKVPNDVELNTLRNLARSRLNTDQKEQHKRESLKRVQALAAAGQFEEALRILQDLRGVYPDAHEVESLFRSVQSARERHDVFARETRKRAEEAEAQRLRHIAELEVLTRTVHAEPDPSKLRMPAERTGDEKNEYGTDSEAQNSPPNATRVLDARRASLQKPLTPAQESATRLFGSADDAIRQSWGASARDELAAPVAAGPARPGLSGPITSQLRTLSKSRLVVILGAAAAVVVIATFVVRAVLFRPSASVRIATIPAGATVTVAGQTCADPHCELRLGEGTYTAEAHLDGYQASWQSFTVRSGQKSASVTLTLKPLESPPGDMAKETLPAAPSAAANPMTASTPNAETAKGTIQIMAVSNNGSASISGAEVVIDGKYYGETGSNGILTVPLQPRRYTIEVRKQGYESLGQKVIEVGAGQQSKLELALQPIAAAVPSKLAEAKSPGQAATGGGAPQKTTPPPMQVASAASAGASGSTTSPSTSNPASSAPGARSPSTAGYSQPQPNASAIVASPPTRTSAETNTVPAPLVTDKKAISTALEQYKDAYESESMDELLKIWPSMSKSQKKAMKSAFESAQAIRVSLSCGDPTILDDAATVKCNQEVKYTRDGKVEPPQTVSIDVLLKKKENVWLVSTLRAN